MAGRARNVLVEIHWIVVECGLCEAPYVASLHVEVEGRARTAHGVYKPAFFFHVASYAELIEWSQCGRSKLANIYFTREVAGITGKYFHKCKQKKPWRWAEDDDGAKKLWDASEKLVPLI